MDADLTLALSAPPSEAAVEAALRVADAYRAQVADLRAQLARVMASNVALRLAGAPNAGKAELIDHIVSASDSSLVLCHATYSTKTGRWNFAPLSSIEEARQVMEADRAAAQAEADDNDHECAQCAGTGEGAHEGASCAACRGRGH